MKQIYLKSIFLSLLMVVMGNVGAFGAQDVTWVKTDPTDLATGDVVVIVDLTSNMAMSNNNGTSAAPAATEVVFLGDKSQITSVVEETLQWEVTVDNGSYKFGVSGTENYLYCTNTNNGVRVGTNSNNAFIMNQADANNNEDYLYNSATSRYVGCYSSQDWRCYTTVNNNIKDTRIAFYKKVTTVSDKTLTGLMISGYPTEFYVGDEFTFGEEGTVTAVYDDNSTKVVTQNCQFSEPDMSTAGTKTVTITYTEDEIEVSETYNITVKERTLEFIELGGDYKTEFNVGDEFVFGGTVTATYDDNSTLVVTQNCQFSEPDMSTAGTKTVTITYTEGEMEAEATYNITVSVVPVTEITLNQETLQLKAGKTAQLTATVEPENATDKTVTWSSDDESVATVAEDGTVTAVAEGNAIITAATPDGAITATCAVTVAAASVADGYYVKVTEAPTNWSGEYLIVYESANVAFDGSLTTLDAVGNTIEVEFEDGKIPAYPEVKAAQFTIAQMEGGYSIKSASGKYIGVTGYSNGLVSSDSEIANKLSVDGSGNAVITVTTSGGDMTLRFNSASNQTRFRYFKSGQQAIQLYKKEVTTTNEYTLVAGDEETPFEGLELTKELPAQTDFYIKDSNGNEYHSADAQSVVTINAENHENLPTSAEGKDFYLVKANTWVFTLTEGDEGALTLTVSPETAGETKYMLTSSVLVVSDDVFDENLKLTKEMTTDVFYITRSDDYGLTNLLAADFNGQEGPKPFWEFSEDNPTVGFITVGIWGAYKVAEAGMYTFTLDLENNKVTATKIAKQYSLVVGETEYAFDEQLTLTQELPAKTDFNIKDSEGNVYHSADAQSVVTINAENHENLPTSAEGKDFYLVKANTWVFTLTEGDEGALTLTVSPQTAGTTKYMLTSSVLAVSDDVFDENLKLTKEMTTDVFYITRSDDYGLTNLLAAEFNGQEGPKPFWEFSEDNPTVGFITVGIWGAYKVAEAGMYTFTLDLENKTVTAEVATEVTATGNLNNSTTGVFAGQQGYTSGAHSYTGTFSTAFGDVTVDYAGSPNSYLNGSEIRMYGDKATLTLKAPNGYAFKEIVFTGTDIANLIADVGTYDADNKIWTGSGEKTETTVVFTSSESKKNLKTVTVTLEEAAPKSPLAGLRVEDYTKDEFLVGDAFEFDGKVIAIYEDQTEKDVTEDSNNITFTGYDMDTAGEYQVTVSYTEDEVTMTTQYDITVREPETVTFRKITSTDGLEAGKRYVIVNESNQRVIAEYYNQHFEVNEAEISDERVTLAEGRYNFLTLGGGENAWTFATSIESGKYLALTGDGNYLEPGADATADAAQWTISFVDGNAVIQSNNFAERYIRYNSNQPRFACYKGTQQPIQLYVEVDENDVDLTISSVGYATLYYSDRDLKVPAGVTAKTYKVVDGKLTESKAYEAGKVIPAGEAVVLKGAAGNYTFFASSTTETLDADNQLKGSDEEEMTTGGKYYYALQAKAADGSGGPGMYWMVDDGGAFMNGAHKAYMALPEMFDDPQGVDGARSFYLFEDATGINNAQADGEAAKVQRFNMSGQRVGNNYKGIVIVNGKKFMQK